MPAGLDFQFSFRPAPCAGRCGTSDVFRLLVLGNFSGHGTRATPLAGRVPGRVDVDNFEAFFRRLAPRLRLSLQSGTEVALELTSLEDFHADALYRRLPLFQAPRDLRSRLMNPASFAAAAAELYGRPADAVPESDSSTLDRLLGAGPAGTPQRASTPSGHAGLIDGLLRQAVAPHVVAAPSPQRDICLQTLDARVATQLSEVLHHPEFQALEAAWLSLRSLVASLGGNAEIHLEVLDASRAELAADLAAADTARSGLWVQLVEGGTGAPGGAARSAVAACFSFGPGTEDLNLLAALAAVSAGTGAPLLVDASPALLGIAAIAAQPDPRDWPGLAPADAARWQALRQSALAPWIGLALPRVLARLPYGRRGEPMESLPFEELGPNFPHESCLWGSAALALAQVLGLGFLENGEDMVPGDLLDLGELPAFVHEVDGERLLLPCAEVLLGERAVDALLSRGLMPLISHRDRNAIRVPRFQSIASPAAPLAGHWGREDQA